MCEILRVVGLGAGGHARVVMDILRLMGGYEIVGLLDRDRTLWATEVQGVRVLGGDDLLSDLYDRGVPYAFIGLGSVGNAAPRRELYHIALNHGFRIAAAIHPRAVIGESVEIGHGVTIMAGAIVNVAVRLGDNVIVNTGAIVEHDCVIGDHVHVATGAHVAGMVEVGEGAHVGLGASILQGVRIGPDAIVGAGTVVLGDVPAGTTVAGVPARVLREASA